MQRKRQPVYHDPNFSKFYTQSQAWRSIQRRFLSGLLCPWLFASSSWPPVLPPHSHSSPHQPPGSVLEEWWYRLCSLRDVSTGLQPSRTGAAVTQALSLLIRTCSLKAQLRYFTLIKIFAFSFYTNQNPTHLH